VLETVYLQLVIQTAISATRLGLASVTPDSAGHAMHSPPKRRASVCIICCRLYHNRVDDLLFCCLVHNITNTKISLLSVFIKPDVDINIKAKPDSQPDICRT